MSEVIIFDHNSHEYQIRATKVGLNHGCYYYSKEIVENIIPLVDTDRNWVTVNIPGRCWDHSIVFIHNNLNPNWYRWLKNYKDLVLVCSLPFAVENMKEICPDHKVILLPLSVDVKYVKQFRTKKTKDAAYAGRLAKLNKKVPAERRAIPDNVDILGGMSREELLKAMAPYRTVYAVGRTAIEAKILGAKIGIYNNLCPEDNWKVIDNRQAAVILQKKLDIIDGKERTNASKKGQRGVAVRDDWEDLSGQIQSSKTGAGYQSEPSEKKVKTFTICHYCQLGDYVYSNDDSGELVAGDDNDGVLKGVEEEFIKIDRNENGHFLFYSPGADENGVHDFYPIGEPIYYCPNCGRKLQ